MVLPGPKRSTLQAMYNRLANGNDDGDQTISDIMSGTSVASGVIDMKTEGESNIDINSMSEELSSLCLGPNLTSFLNIGAPSGNSQVDSYENGMFLCYASTDHLIYILS